MFNLYRKKWVAIGFVLCLFNVVYAYSDGNGTPAEPYQIASVSDWNDLMKTSSDWNKYFIMTADIDLQGITLAPVGNSSKNFTGVFDGNDHVIRNADINRPASDYIGLFGYVGSGGQIRDLGVEDVNMTGNDGVGGLVGYNYGTIADCYVTGAVGGGYEVGGLVGRNYGNLTACYAASVVTGSVNLVGGLVGCNYGNLTTCYATGVVTGSGNYVGGLVGYNWKSDTYPATITDCYSTGTVIGSGNYVGGLVGRTSGTIIDCRAAGAVIGGSNSQNVGGLVGMHWYGTIDTCYATGGVSCGSSSRNVGGLVGVNYSDFYGGITRGIISDSYSTGAVTGGSYVGGLAGYMENGSASSCYSMGAVVGDSNVGGLVGYSGDGSISISGCYFLITSGPDNGLGTPLTDGQMKQQSSFVGWDFTTPVWKICNHTNYPKLAWQELLAGDFVCPDGVDFYDFAVLAKQWTLEKLSEDIAPGTGDGTINFIDWAVTADGWQGDMNELADFTSQWLRLSAYCADIAPAGGDGVVDTLDFVAFAENWLEGT